MKLLLILTEFSWTKLEWQVVIKRDNKEASGSAEAILKLTINDKPVWPVLEWNQPGLGAFGQLTQLQENMTQGLIFNLYLFLRTLLFDIMQNNIKDFLLQKFPNSCEAVV